MQSTEVRLKRRPVGMPERDDFELVTVDVPAPKAGEVQVANVCMSVDPYMRGRMIDRKSYAPPFEVGASLDGGAISQYNATEPVPGPDNLALAIGLTFRGFIVSHFDHMADDFRRDMTAWGTAGDIEYQETVYHGIAQAPDAFMGLFTGANVGKMVVQLAD